MTERPYAAGGMGPPIPLPLPYAAVDAYAGRIGCDPDARATLHDVIGALDADWLPREQQRISEAVKER